MTSESHPIHHLGYWVDDLEEAAWRFHRTLGIGPFALASHITFAHFALAGREEEPVVFDHSAAFAAWGSVVIELGQVHEIDDDLARAYAVGSGGLSHVSWLAADLDAERARLAEFGCEFINTAQTGPVSVLWVSGGSLFEHPIEVHLDTDFIRGMHGRLAQRAQEWDGREIFAPMG